MNLKVAARRRRGFAPTVPPGLTPSPNRRQHAESRVTLAVIYVLQASAGVAAAPPRPGVGPGMAGPTDDPTDEPQSVTTSWTIKAPIRLGQPANLKVKSEFSESGNSSHWHSG
jgi:hypothetical protein